MILSQKKVGETPLEMLDRLREEQPRLKDEKLSYAGRLDPMAEGEMLILVGDKENRNYKRYLGFDKEYKATFMIGMKTDTGDVLGLIKKTRLNKKVDIEKLNKEVLELKEIKEQKYPWFSSKTVNGLKLFDHYKKGNTQIERPVRDVEIKAVELLDLEDKSSTEIKEYILNSIQKVNGDFRQNKIIKKWQKFFDDNQETILQIFEVKILVSSGTYIRALTESFSFPATLLKLDRTKIFING